ncbi:hypothetical protein GQ607_017283 [Colletotrichum asianum]|uniref:Uncharacterized protein n=1 Tax=Colletotrichum asianum TaxID=702518 RepID=A0A8H3ZDG8_9PEZI|nr:hypothetical protein GQ607_017283 [Colletotrichum asianum]
MARPFAHPRERRAPNAESNLESGTPPEKDAFLQTLTTSCDLRPTPDRYVNNFIQALEACRDPPASYPTPTLRQGLTRIATSAIFVPMCSGMCSRLNYDPASRFFDIRMPAPVHEVFSISLVSELDKELQHIARQPDKDGAFAAQPINGGSSRIVIDHAVEESADGEPTSQESVPCTITLQRHPDVRFQYIKAAFPGVVVEVFYSQNGKDTESLAWEYIRISTDTSKPLSVLTWTTTSNHRKYHFGSPNTHMKREMGLICLAFAPTLLMK